MRLNIQDAFRSLNFLSHALGTSFLAASSPKLALHLHHFYSICFQAANLYCQVVTIKVSDYWLVALSR